jgi:hypothetical protein
MSNTSSRISETQSTESQIQNAQSRVNEAAEKAAADSNTSIQDHIRWSRQR